MKKERPILFNGEMVRAILDGRKTQTRRIANPKLGPLFEESARVNGRVAPNMLCGDIPCPFGTVGDTLWVRETFWINHFEFVDGPLPSEKPKEIEEHEDQWCPYMLYAADGTCCEQLPECECATEGKPKWRPSIHMPRWASRITLQVTGVRIERLQEISEEDAKAEGMFFTDYGRFCFHKNKPLKETDCPAPDDTHPLLEGWSWGPTKSHKECLGTARGAFANLWSQVYGSASWYENPWVWVVEFRRLEAQEKAA